jgi:hypothetical protein
MTLFLVIPLYSEPNRVCTPDKDVTAYPDGFEEIGLSLVD